MEYTGSMSDLAQTGGIDRDPVSIGAHGLGRKLFVATHCQPSGGWPLRLGLEEQDLRKVVADGALTVAIPKEAHCPYCNRSHDFSLSVQRTAAEKALADSSGRGPSRAPDDYPRLANWNEFDYRSSPVSLYPPTTVTIDTRTKGLALKPADAAALYKRGGSLARKDDQASLRDACAALRQAIKIYLANGRTRDAGYARTYLASALIKLADPEAKEQIAEARASLTAADKDILGYLDILEKELLAA